MERKNVTKKCPGRVSLTVLTFVLAAMLPMASQLWGMGFRPSLAGMIAPEFSLSDLAGRAQRLQDFSGQDRAAELLGYVVQALYDRDAGNAGSL